MAFNPLIVSRGKKRSQMHKQKLVGKICMFVKVNITYCYCQALHG